MTDPPLNWFYLSFADDDGFLGGCYVLAASGTAAIMVSIYLQIDPGGEAMILGPLPDDDVNEHVPEGDRHRLLTKAELEAQG